jgi:hypothetical protein
MQQETMSGLNMVEAARNGRIFTVEVIKRTNGEHRVMVCRRGVRKGITGRGMSYDPISKALLTVWDVQKGAYRMVNLERLVALKMGGKTFRWNGKRFYRVA